MTTIEAPREQTRARYPDEEGYVERDGVRIFYEVYGSGEPTVLLLPTWSIIHSRHWKAQIPYLARHARVVTFDGRGNGRSDRPDTVEAYAEREFAADALAVMDATGTERAVIVGLSAGALLGHPARRRAPRARGRRRVHRAGRAVRPAPGARDRRRSTSRWSPTRAGRSTTATTGSSTTATSSSSSSRRSSPSRTRPSRSRTASAGASRPTPRDARAHVPRPRAARPRRVRARCADRIALPRARHPRHRRRGPAVRRRRGARGGDRRRRSSRSRAPGTARTRATRCASTCCCATSSRRRPAPRRWTRGRAPRASARSTSPRRSGSATRGATSRSPASCARLHPDLEIDWLAQHPVTAALEAAGERVHPASRDARPTSRATSSPSRPSTTCTASRRGGAWTRSSSPTSWSSTTSSASSRLRPLDRRRGLGDRLLPAREPGAEARRLRVADRLRRLAADARRRRARGRRSPPTTTPR